MGSTLLDLPRPFFLFLRTVRHHTPPTQHPKQGCALSSNVALLQYDTESQQLSSRIAIRQSWLPVSGWALPQLPPLITDILISLNDKWLFFSNWLRGEGGVTESRRVCGCVGGRGQKEAVRQRMKGLSDQSVVSGRVSRVASSFSAPSTPPTHTPLFFTPLCAGDVCMYDISNPAEPRLASRLWLGGSIAAGGGVGVDAEGLATLGLTQQPEAPVVKGVKIQGGPQMLQLRWAWVMIWWCGGGMRVLLTAGVWGWMCLGLFEGVTATRAGPLLS